MAISDYYITKSTVHYSVNSTYPVSILVYSSSDLTSPYVSVYISILCLHRQLKKP